MGNVTKGVVEIRYFPPLVYLQPRGKVELVVSSTPNNCMFVFF